MTEAQRIADALVDRGILDFVGNHREMSRPGYTELGRFYWVVDDEEMSDSMLEAKEAISDWRVAGKCLEAMTVKQLERFWDFTPMEDFKDPAAICKTYVEAKDAD